MTESRCALIQTMMCSNWITGCVGLISVYSPAYSKEHIVCYRPAVASCGTVHIGAMVLLPITEQKSNARS